MTNMTDSKLLHLCGIEGTKVTREEVWVSGRLKFLSPQNYVLGTRKVRFRLSSNSGGFGLCFDRLPDIPASSFMGKSCKDVTIADAVLCHEVFELSLASLTHAVYPQVLRTGDTVDLL